MNNGVPMRAWRWLSFLAGAIIVVGIVIWIVPSVAIPSFATTQGIERITVVLKGENVLSEAIPVPEGVRLYYVGPSGVKVHFPDGTVGSIDRWNGPKPGPWRKFSGAKGDTVFMDIVYR